MSYKATSFVCLLFHEYTAVKSIEMHYQACKCRNQILSKFTIVTPEANGRSFQEMNPKSAWLSPRNLHQLFHLLNCPSQIVCHPRSDITITNYTQSISTTTLEIFDVGFVLYMSNMFATCVIWLFLSIYSKKRLGFSQCFSWNLAVWGHINTLKPSDANMWECIGSSLVRVLPCCPCGTKPLFAQLTFTAFIWISTNNFHWIWNSP